MPNKNSKTALPSERLKITSLVCLIIVLVFIFLLSYLIFNFLEESNFFRISYIKVINRPILGNVPPSYFYNLVEREADIFSIDLKRIEQKILSDFTRLDKVAVIRGFPDHLIFNLSARHILAQISLGKNRYFEVDSNGFILSNPHPQANPNFPIVLGVSQEGPLLRPNQKTASGRLLYALSFIKQYQGSNWLAGEKLVALDVSDNYALTFFLEDNLEVRILKTEISPKIKILESLIKEIRANNPAVKCIDLRFKDVIINPKKGAHG